MIIFCTFPRFDGGQDPTTHRRVLGRSTTSMHQGPSRKPVDKFIFIRSENRNTNGSKHKFIKIYMV